MKIVGLGCLNLGKKSINKYRNKKPFLGGARSPGNWGA